MKKLLLLLISLLLSFNSYGEWKVISKDENFNTYIDLDTIKKSEGFINWWSMKSDNKTSIQIYSQGDCYLKRIKSLQTNTYRQAMAKGDSRMVIPNDSWEYLPPKSKRVFYLNLICALQKQKNYDERLYMIDLFTEFFEETGETEEEKKIRKLKEELKAEQELAMKLIAQEKLNVLKSAYVNNIAARVKTFWRYQSAEDDWTCEVYVIQDRQGQVKAVDVRNCNVGDSSLAKSFRDSIERAVYKASPLPAAPDESVFDSEMYMLFSVN